MPTHPVCFHAGHQRRSGSDQEHSLGLILIWIIHPVCFHTEHQRRSGFMAGISGGLISTMATQPV